MTNEQKEKMMKDFGASVTETDDYPEWTDKELMATAKIIAKKMGLTESFYSGEK